MNVLHLISTGGFYGAESMLLSLAEAQLRSGLRPAIAVFRHDDDSHVALFERAREAGIEAHLIPCRGRWDRRTVDGIKTLLDRGVTVLHCHGYKADVYGFAAARGGRIAMVSTCHNWPDRRFSMRAYAMLDRLVLRWFDQVTTPSRAVAAVLRRAGVTASKTTVIENGIDVARFQRAEPVLRSELPGCKVLIGYVGRLVEEKGGEALLHAAKTVLATCPGAAFVFAGDGPCRVQWESLAVELGIQDRVVFLGVRGDMPKVYASLDILVLPSLEEAMPMCLLEGLASARPVIATRVGEVPKLIESGSTGELIEAGHSDALSESILRFIADPIAALSMGRNAQKLVTSAFSSDAMARNYLGVYHGALASKPNGIAVAARKVDAI